MRLTPTERTEYKRRAIEYAEKATRYADSPDPTRSERWLALARFYKELTDEHRA